MSPPPRLFPPLRRPPRRQRGAPPTNVRGVCPFIWRAGNKKLCTLLDLCVSSLRRGHANLLCIVPILSDDPREESTWTSSLSTLADQMHMRSNAVQRDDGLRCDAMHWSAVRRDAVECKAVRCNRLRCDAMRCHAMPCIAMRRTAMHVVIRSHGVTVSTLDSESSDRGSNPRETLWGQNALATGSYARTQTEFRCAHQQSGAVASVLGS